MRKMLILALVVACTVLVGCRSRVRVASLDRARTRSLGAELKYLDATQPGVMCELRSSNTRVAKLIAASVHRFDELEAKRPGSKSSHAWALARPIALRISETQLLPPGAQLDIMRFQRSVHPPRLDLSITLTGKGVFGYRMGLVDLPSK